MAKAQTRNGNKLLNGVDITLTERYFPAKEWTQLGPQGQKILNDCPKCKAKKEALMSCKKRNISSASTQNGNHNDLLIQHQTLAAELINIVMQASTSVADDEKLFSRDSALSCVHMPQIGTHAACNTSVVSTLSHPNYYHHVNVVHELLTSVSV